MNAKKFREEYQKLRANKDELLDLDFIGCTYKNQNGEIIKKGFFELYHGDKDSEIDFLRSQVQIAEDGQAIYEFLQNAVDAQASEFCIFWDKNNLLVINNGKKFDYNGIKSILNFSQSTKSNDEYSIGKFGIGFKLIHRLVGDRIKGEDEENGLNAIINKYKGPILFSWNDFYLKKLLKEDLSDIDNHWFFKIIYTNFPAGLEENIYDKNYKKRIMFKNNEFLEMVRFINNHNLNLDNYKEGSLFYLKLGKKKSNLLDEELESAKNGIKYSANILKSFTEKNKLQKIILQNIQINISNFYSLKYKNSILLFPNNLEQSKIYYNSMTSNISFYKFFPMGDQKNSFNFIVHNNNFDIESNRRKLQETQENKYILKDLSENIFKNINSDIQKIILANLYLSDLTSSNNDSFIQENFSKYFLNYLKSNIPYKYIDIYGKKYLKVTNDKSKVIVLDSKIEDIPLKEKYHFYFNLKKYKDIVKEAVNKLNIQQWNIIEVMIKDNINEWILNLDEINFKIFLEEVADIRYNYLQQKIINIWNNSYTLEQIKKILAIFNVLDREKIIFAIVKNTKNHYEIIHNIKNKYIKNLDFKEFLESNYKTNEMEWYIIPKEIETQIISIIGKNSNDKELLKKLLENNEHKKVINFIKDYKLEKEFLDTLDSLNFDLSKKYYVNCYEYKVLDIILKYFDKINIGQIRSKILFNNKTLNSSLISRYITFEFDKVINPISYKNEISQEILSFIENIDNKYKQIFELKEESKEKVYDFIKNEIYSNYKLKKQINTKNRLKFILYYSLEKNKNYFKDFNGVNIYNYNTKGDESYGLTYKTLKDISEKVLKEAPFKIDHLFPNSLNKVYYIQDKKYAITKEYLPDNFKNKYLKIFKNIGLNIDDSLIEIRKNLLNNKNIDRDTLRELSSERIINTINFLSQQDLKYIINSNDIKVLQSLFRELDDSYKINLEYLPCLLDSLSIKLKKVGFFKDYITSKILENNNEYFQKRLSKEMKENNVIYIDILDFDFMPSSWNLIEESEEEKMKNEKQILNKYEKNIEMNLRNQDKDSNEYRWIIGWKGEKYIYEKLVKKFGIDKVVWHNKHVKSIKDDKGGIDIEIKDDNENTIHNIEIKTTIKSIFKDKSVNFTLSSKQFEAATTWGKDTHLIFVTGIEDDEPRILYMNFDNNWLE